VPEGDTLHRTAEVLREALVGRPVTGARGRADGVALQRVVGDQVQRVEARGKHLLIDFSGGLTLHTHLRMHGSWHCYRAGERWLRSPARAVAVIETEQAVAVCFDAPTVELIDSRALALHPGLARLGPDLARDAADLEEAFERLRHPGRAGLTVGEGLLDQSAQSGLGNVYRSEVCFLEGVDPLAVMATLDDATLRRLIATGHRLLVANRSRAGRITMPDALGGPAASSGPRSPGRRLWVYGRAGRPCRRCGTLIRSAVVGDLPRPVYWCPSCQPAKDLAESVGDGSSWRSVTPGSALPSDETMRMSAASGSSQGDRTLRPGRPRART
jgi:endonuclease VIII